MLWLSDEAIEYAVAKCRREPGYKVAIALNSRAKYTQIEMCLRDCLEDTDEFRIRKSACDMTIEFHNGSYIRTVYASENARGNKVHLLIADEAVDYDVLHDVLEPCEILESIDRQRRRNADALCTYLSRSWPQSGLRAKEPSAIDMSKIRATLTSMSAAYTLESSNRDIMDWALHSCGIFKTADREQEVQTEHDSENSCRDKYNVSCSGREIADISPDDFLKIIGCG